MAYASTGQVVINLHAVYLLSAMVYKARPKMLFGSSSQNKVDFFLVKSTVYKKCSQKEKKIQLEANTKDKSSALK